MQKCNPFFIITYNTKTFIMKKITKDMVMSTLDTLIKSYANGSADHFECPLCILYKVDGSLDSCSTCPNQAFEPIYPKNIEYPINCTQRCFNYPNLSYLKFSELTNSAKLISNNDKTLSEFWKEVRDLFDISHPDDVINLVDELKSEILLIAKKYQ